MRTYTVVGAYHVPDIGTDPSFVDWIDAETPSSAGGLSEKDRGGPDNVTIHAVFLGQQEDLIRCIHEDPCCEQGPCLCNRGECPECGTKVRKGG